MSNKLDVRTKIYCNLGTVISGQLQEGSIIGAGLINVTGSLLLSGVYQIKRGKPVELAYYKGRRMVRLGQYLLVTSSFANPVTRTTEVNIGCPLTYYKDTAPPPTAYNSVDDSDTPDLEGIEKLLMQKVTKAGFIARVICETLKIEYNKIAFEKFFISFYREKFEVKGPLLNVLSDILISENKVGYITRTIDDNGVPRPFLSLIDLKEPPTLGARINQNVIIDVSPINTGDPPADIVYSIIQRKKVKLDDALTQDTGETPEEILDRNNIPKDDPIIQAIINSTPPSTPEEKEQQEAKIRETQKPPYWLTSYTDAGPQVRYFRHQPPKIGSVQPEPIYDSLYYSAKSTRVSEYDSQDRQTKVTETVYGPWGTSITEDKYEYTVYEGYEKVVKTREVFVRCAEAVEACGFPAAVMPPLPGDIQAFASRYDGTLVRKEKIIETTVAVDTSTITTAARYASAVWTSAGAANIQKYIESFTKGKKDSQIQALFTDAEINKVLNMAITWVFDGTVTTYGEKAATQTIITRAPSGQREQTAPVSNDDVLRELVSIIATRPTNPFPEDTEVTSIEEEEDPKNGSVASVLEVPEIILAAEDEGAPGIILELTPPYVSDDKVTKGDDGFYFVEPSNAPEMALTFARIQNRLRYGRRHGQSLVLPPEYIPRLPFSAIYLSLGSLKITGQYRSDALSIVFDSSGILVSIDAIYWGAVGQ